MTHEEVLEMMEGIGLPYAYDHFAEGESPDPPFAVFLYPSADNFSAAALYTLRQTCCISNYIRIRRIRTARLWLRRLLRKMNCFSTKVRSGLRVSACMKCFMRQKSEHCCG